MNENITANVREWARSHVTTVAAACVMTVALGVYLLTQHTAHVLGLLPYALILLCPLMHFIPGMHGGHGGHGDHGSHGGQGELAGPQGALQEGRAGDQVTPIEHTIEHSLQPDPEGTHVHSGVGKSRQGT